MEILYLCDGEACDGACSDVCQHTSDIRHAKNFGIVGPEYGANEPIYFERNVAMDEKLENNETAETPKTEKNFKNLDKDSQRFYNLLHTLFNVCTLCGFRIEGRVKIRDLKTGKVWE